MDNENFISLLLSVSLFSDCILGHIILAYFVMELLIIGGYCDAIASSLIAKYTIDKWEYVGNLQNSRYAHRSIANEDRIYVVGGYGTL